MTDSHYRQDAELRKDDPRLNAKWTWGAAWNKSEQKPGQCSRAELINGVRLGVTDWDDYFEASMYLHDDQIFGTYGDESLRTRVEAQIAAENLVREFIALMISVRDVLSG